MAHDPTLARLRKICLALPDTAETPTWGKPHFRVAGKIFAGYAEENGWPALGVKLERAHAELVLADPRFRRAPYVGHAGWVSFDTRGIESWSEVRELILESYRLIAPKRSLAKLDREPARTAAKSRPVVARSTKRSPRRR